MAWSIIKRLSPLKKLRDYVRGVDQRELQRRSDLFKLFLYTQLRERMLHMQGASSGSAVGVRLAGVAEELVEQVGYVMRSVFEGGQWCHQTTCVVVAWRGGSKLVQCAVALSGVTCIDCTLSTACWP